MHKKNLVLWLIFGFVLVTALSSIVDFLTHLIYFGNSELGIPNNIMKFTIPLSSLGLYAIATLILLKWVNNIPDLSALSNDQVPKRIFIAFTTIAILLPLATNKIWAVYDVYIQESIEYSSTNSLDFLELYGWMNAGPYLSQWLTIIVIAAVYYKNLKKKKNKN